MAVYQAPLTQAGAPSKAASELAQWITKKFGKQLTKESGELLAERVGAFVARHGDEGADVLRRVGPEALQIVERAGAHGDECIKLMVRHGDEALWIVRQPQRMAIFVKYGDNAARAMMRHGEIAEPLINRFGDDAAQALTQVNARNARRLAMMADGNVLHAIPSQSPRLLKVIQRYGDGAAEFIWKNKGALMVASSLAVFLDNPEPFLNGALRLSDTAIHSLAQPLAQAAAQHLPWEWLGLSLGALLGGIGVGLLRIYRSVTKAVPTSIMQQSNQGLSTANVWMPRQSSQREAEVSDPIVQSNPSIQQPVFHRQHTHGSL